MNSLHLIRMSDSTISGHGGKRTRRNFELWINGVSIRTYTEDSAMTFNYATGPSFDRAIDAEIAKFEEALNCRVIRGTLRA